MVASLKHFFVGNPISTAQAQYERLTKKIALAVFSSDALSSTAYATEEILRVLAVAAVAGYPYAFKYVVPISLGIAVLIVIVSISYRQTIHAYPTGGGAYIVAKENLGPLAGLAAGAALLIDYILTVSVSITAGVAAITSAAQNSRFAWISNHREWLCIIAILFITLANLRGVREAGRIFAAPTYLFICSFLFMIGIGLFRYFLQGPPPLPPQIDVPAIAEGYNPGPLTTLLLLSAFSNGCTALTGIEAISNGVSAFKEPEARNAANTLIWMSIILIILFLGTSTLAYLYHVTPKEDETVISQFARTIFSGQLHLFYYIVQGATAGILMLAANTSFADFPRLASLLARDGYLPRQFTNLGDRLVFSNGIIILSVLSSLLIIIFGGNTHRLIPLYAVGVFLSFTLSQSGMVVHWWRKGREISDWKKSIFINALGALATAVVLTVFIITKFKHGAWMVVVLIPTFVMMFRAVHLHYEQVAQELRVSKPDPIDQIGQTVIVPISGVNKAALCALQYAKNISNDVRAVHVSVDEKLTNFVKEDWKRYQITIPLIVLESPYRSLVKPLMDYIDEFDREPCKNVLTVVLPEFVPSRWWHHLLHNQASLFIKGALLFRPGTVVTSIPYHLKH